MHHKTASFGREWDSTTYHQISEPQFAWGLKLIEGLDLRGDETILDAGCGSGRLTFELLKRLPQGGVIAVDLSENMLRSARELLDPQFEGRVTYVHRDLRELQIEREADLIFSAATFHWVPERETMFKRLYAALRPLGRFVAQSGAAGSLDQFWKIANEVIESAPFAEHFHGFKRQQVYLDPDVTKAQMKKAGFNDIGVSVHDAPVQFSERSSFKQFMRTVNLKNHLERLPHAAGEELLDRIASKSEASERALTLDYHRINMRAVRA